jgi:hypothetical protein
VNVVAEQAEPHLTNNVSDLAYRVNRLYLMRCG